jgi:hypothetical protein
MMKSFLFANVAETGTATRLNFAPSEPEPKRPKISADGKLAPTRSHQFLKVCAQVSALSTLFAQYL